MGRFGLIGSGLGHTFSPEIHKSLGKYEYEAISLEDDGELESFMEKGDFTGINVTMPFKEKIIAYLDRLDPSAEKIGAVNTVTNVNGIKTGYNTDYSGMKAMIELYKGGVEGKKVIILGSGGSSKTCKLLMNDLGAGSVMIFSRGGLGNTKTYDRGLCEDVDGQIIVNCTPLGMYPNHIDRSPLDLSVFPKLEAVFDLVYNPLRTKLILQAEEMGISAYSGLYMLIMQAYQAVKIFYRAMRNDKQVPNLYDAVELYKKIIYRKKNVVLVGMPTCGKTSTGKILSEMMNRPFYDIDWLIKDKTGLEPARFIKEKGEAEFRKIEKDVIANLKTITGSVIASGGGSVMDPENIESLKANGYLIFIDRPVYELTISDDRPMAKSRGDLENLYKSRRSLYMKADTVIDAKGKTPYDLAQYIYNNPELINEN